MKNILVIPKLVLFCTLLLVNGLALFGEEARGVLSSYDAVVAAPNNHKVVFENEKVRVLEVTIKPGEKDPFHEHSMPSVMTIVTGAPLRITEATLEDGKLVTGKTIEVGKYNSQQPPLWMPPQGLHSAENVGSVTFHAYLIELKD